MKFSTGQGTIRRMPTHFGLSLGPRQGLDGGRYNCIDSPRQTIVEAVFEADPRQLAELLPECFQVRGPAVLTFSFAYVREIKWLAGRGYNTFGIRFPARFQGLDETVDGEFLAVLWENRPEPIITGREELGFSKIYCELPSATAGERSVACTASWEDTRFAELILDNLEPSGEPLQAVASAGLLHHKYIPRTGAWGEADADYPVLTPAGSDLVVEKCSLGSAYVRIHGAPWEAIPTLYREVTALAALQIGKCLGAQVLETRGFKDIYDQRILR